ncbi:probable cytochrome P450 6a13 [Euwallacea fornicatus]|uniref:probable cytochrome P450 6a13 n=1 Tax=Euwallacea fornicatus TaxID=995702 RepID=UPI0033901F2D
MDIFTLTISIVVILVSVIYGFSKWKHGYWRRKGVTQLEPEFFFGNARGLFGGNSSIGEIALNFYRNLRKKKVKFGGVYMSYTPNFVPVDPDIIKDIMQKNFDHFTAHFPPLMFPTIFGKSLFHLEGDAWRKTRKQLSPTFTSGKMKMMFETLLEKTSVLENLIDEYANLSAAVNMKDVLVRFTSDVVGSVGFGIDCNAMKDPDSQFLKQGRYILDPPEKKSSYLDLLIRAFGIRKLRKDIKPAENFFKNMVQQTIDYREKNNVYRKDFMHLMIQLKNRGIVSDDEQIFNKSDNLSKINTNDIYNLDDITAQCLIFFIAGFDTSATTMSFAILELAQHPEMQQKIRDEANEVLERYNGKMTYEAMMELTYTEQVIDETLRKYPPLGNIPRVCTKDYTIPGTDIVVEKGTFTSIPAWGLHLDPEYFPEPEKFDPERFSLENKKNIRDFTYIPFGEGPRMCLGLRFGMMQTKAGLVSLLRNHNFSLNKKTTVPIKTQRDTVITTVDGGIWVDITKVEQ